MPKKPSAIETQVVPRPENDRRQRRRWSAAEKKRILDEAAACEARGELGELLRKEGIYSSHLHNWRRDFEQEGLVGLEPKPTGRKPLQTESEREIAKLTRKNSQLAAQLSLAQKVIELQKKAHEILGIALPSIEDDSSN
jgi:transposase-like protein